jgi:hypothetical protein
MPFYLEKTNMETSKTRFHLFLTIFIIGALSGLTLTVLSTWADLESAYYGFARRAGAGLSGLSCPILMTANETNAITLKVTNNTERKLSPAIRTEISTPTIAFEATEYVELQAGDSAVRQWEIGPDNVDLRYFIFAKVLVYSFYPNPDKEGTCGIFIVNLPGNGATVTWTMVILSLLGMGIGLYGMNKVEDADGGNTNLARQLIFLAMVIIFGLVTVFMGWWVQGILLLVVALLFSMIALGLMLNRAKIE